MLSNFDGLLVALILLGPLLLLQRSLHRAVQAVFLLLTRRKDVTLVLFSLLFAPGVLLHEVSHYLMALLLQVRTGRFSLLPRTMPDGRLQLGYVETIQADFFRDALIGAAPLLTGGAFISYVGLGRLDLTTIWLALSSGDARAVLWGVWRLPEYADFWLWFYLAFTVSSTMLPSPADRRAWLTFLLVILALLALAWLVGMGPWLLENLAPLFNRVMQSLSVVLGISVALHSILLPPIWLIQRLLSRLTGLQIV